MRSVIVLLVAFILVGTVCVSSFPVQDNQHNGDINGNNYTNGNNNTTSENHEVVIRTLLEFSARNAISGANFWYDLVLSLLELAGQQDVTIPQEYQTLLSKANDLLEEAVSLFEKGNYDDAAKTALDAVYLYQDLIAKLEGLLGVRLLV